MQVMVSFLELILKFKQLYMNKKREAVECKLNL